jgi:WD40 repeat protein
MEAKQHLEIEQRNFYFFSYWCDLISRSDSRMMQLSKFAILLITIISLVACGGNDPLEPELEITGIEDPCILYPGQVVPLGFTGRNTPADATVQWWASAGIVVTPLNRLTNYHAPDSTATVIIELTLVVAGKVLNNTQVSCEIQGDSPTRVSPDSGSHCPSLPGSLIDLEPINPHNLNRLKLVGQIIAPQRIISVALSGDGEWLVAISTGGVCIYEVSSLAEKYAYRLAGLTSATFSHRGDFVSAGDETGGIKVWRLRPNSLEMSGLHSNDPTNHTQRITDLAFNMAGSWLASASTDNTLRVWNTHTNSQLNNFGQHNTPVHSLAWVQENMLVSGDSDGVLTLWRINGDLSLDKLDVHELNKGMVTNIVYNADKAFFASSSNENTEIVLWRITSNELLPLRTFLGHSQSIASINFNFNGQLLVSASNDTNVIIWDTDTGRELRKLTDQEAVVYEAAFSPQGNLLITASHDGVLRLWGVPREQ